MVIPRELLDTGDLQAIQKIARTKIKGEDLVVHKRDTEKVFALIEANDNKLGPENQFKTLSLRALTTLLQLGRDAETTADKAAVLAGALQLAQMEPSLAGRANAIIASLR